MWNSLSAGVTQGAVKALARAISLVENEQEGYMAFLEQLPRHMLPVVGITGPPGAGKSTLTDALVSLAVQQGKKVAVICVDPSSPFHFGALLGDRIRLSRWYLSNQVFIRSLASRGAMGGLNPKIIEITDLLKAAPFDLIIVETVGVGQSEIEIAGLADVTVVVLVPEAGDEVQTMKTGLMEIADIFVVNKSDRPGADLFIKNLRQMLAPVFARTKELIPVLPTVATEGTGIDRLYEAIQKKELSAAQKEQRSWLLAEKAYHLIQKERMKGIDKSKLKLEITENLKSGPFNLYKFVMEQYTKNLNG
ncbi:methylmalonyl Co-A mutase-associated GTPase MeaB [Niabella drilacis]|uniref:LAO/AO transport system kinase n=1 Tax=Niabella drilacis (strain DSM 25811 / CCM 8410 / CCUG 62505 / LMG 26954 / E90) TaxID=1285928 RepID=A0A1G6PHW4_NIADE|nr:methylmalonyl Co-A mutase-associated GTPase MeaB [Niabella drilacis]SDC79649.1 LAO/AO transport system kinase [Niabella drilacis]